MARTAKIARLEPSPLVELCRDPPPLPRPPHPEQHEQRPDQVELLLRRQGPVVLRRRGGVVGGEVVDRVDRERPVLDVQRGRQDLAEELLPEQPRHPQEHPDRRDEQHEVRRRQQPPHPSGPEPGQVHRAVAVDLAQDVGGDQEAGDDEEDVDAHVPTGQPVGPQVEQDDQEHGDRSQSLDLLTHRSMLQSGSPGSALQLPLQPTGCPPRQRRLRCRHRLLDRRVPEPRLLHRRRVRLVERLAVGEVRPLPGDVAAYDAGGAADRDAVVRDLAR